MKVRIKFSKTGHMKFVGHLDTMRYFQKAIRRSGLPVAFSGGYSPHMIMSFAAPLGVGTTSLGEYFDVELTETVATDEIERRLKELCDIPVFHDDQHGTAIVVAAAMINAMKVTGKEMGKMRIVINGAGAAGIAIGKLLISMGFGNVIMCDINGIICEGDEGLNPGQEEISHISNLGKEHGLLADAMKGADAFVGVSRPGLVTREMVASMNQGIVFAMANPTPEIMPDEAKAGGAAVIGTGRSDFPNQINNVLVFPGIFKGALAVRAKEITETMKQRAAYAIASMIPEDHLGPENIIPSALDKTVAGAVAKAVADTAVEEGIARI